MISFRRHVPYIITSCLTFSMDRAQLKRKQVDFTLNPNAIADHMLLFQQIKVNLRCIFWCDWYRSKTNKLQNDAFFLRVVVLCYMRSSNWPFPFQLLRLMRCYACTRYWSSSSDRIEVIVDLHWIQPSPASNASNLH